MKIIKYLLIATLFSLFSCSIQQMNKEENNNCIPKGSITLNIGETGNKSINRTVVPDFASSVDSYSITLTSQDGYPSKTGILTMPSPAVTFTNVEVGNWDISVLAKKAGLVVGMGSSTNQLLTDGATLAVSIPIQFSQLGGKGNLSLTIFFPNSIGVDYVSGLIAGTNLIPTVTSTTNINYRKVMFNITNIDSGIQKLIMSFKKGGSNGTVAGIFRESVNIWNNITSDKWIDLSGALVPIRVFSSNEFYSANANLADLQISTGSISFNSLTTNYDLGLITNLSITLSPSGSVSGQYIEYQINNSAWIEIQSGTTSAITPFDLADNFLSIKVTAPDKQTTKYYYVKAKNINYYKIVSYNSMGGPSLVNQIVTNGTFATQPVSPAYYIDYLGFYTDPGFTDQWDFAVNNVTSNITLYLKWKLTSTPGLAYTLINGNTAYSVSKGSTTSSNVIIIPAVYSELPVISIGNSAFANSYLTDISIPDSVTSIGDSAFLTCSYLLYIALPTNITMIRSHTFNGCMGLSNIIIPNGVTIISNNAFSHCTGLTSISLPNSIKSIGNVAFYGCLQLSTIILPTNIISIGKNAFENCSNLSAINIPDSVTNIGYEAFNRCSSLTNISVDPSNLYYQSISGALYNKSGTTIFKMPEGISGAFTISSTVTNIAYEAFWGSLKLSNITIPNSVISIESNAFASCWGLTNLTLPESVIKIGKSAFISCRGLTSINLPTNITRIEDYLLYDCFALNSITVPNKVYYIGAYAFSASHLTNIILHPTTPPTLGAYAFQYCAQLSNISVPSGSVAAYKAAPGWSQYSNLIVAQ